MVISFFAVLTLAACPPAASCAEADGLLSVAATQERADSVLATALEARAQFAASFGRSPGKTAIVEDLSLYPGFAATLQDEGWILKPWISPAAMHDALAAQIRPALRQAMPDASDAAIEAQITSALAARLGGDETVRHAEAIIAHELGHFWFIDVYDWPEHADGSQRAYGAAAAPDWLDETAAVSLESDALTAERREALCQFLPEDPAAEHRRFFAVDHPLINAARRAGEAADTAEAAAREAAGEDAAGAGERAPRILVLDSSAFDVADESLSNVGYYYALARNLVDWAEAEADGIALFAALAETLSAGGSVDAFLDARSREPGFPADLDAWSERLGAFAQKRCAGPERGADSAAE